MKASSFTSSSNRQFFRKLGIVVTLIVVLDFAIGKGLAYLYSLQRSGLNYQTIYAVTKSSEDVLIFGTSITIEGYYPPIFEDSLQMSVYNIARHGQSILYDLAVQEMILKRYRPKIFILDLQPNCLFYVQRDYDQLAALLPYYRDHPEIRYILKWRSRWEPVKMLSSIYPYNSELLPIIDNIIEEDTSINGYRALHHVMSEAEYKERKKRALFMKRRYANATIDTVKVRALERFISNAQQNGVAVFAVIPPILLEIYNYASHDKLIEVCKAAGVPVFDYTFDERIRQLHYFGDLTHLNHQGALLFSADVASRIKHFYLTDKVNQP